MRLFRIDDDNNLSLVQLFGDGIPPYAMLSHTWGPDDEEVTYNDQVTGAGVQKGGYRKIEFCHKQATVDNLRYFWIDTCCIDKSSSAELAEAINSMFRWYQNASKCYVYLPDVSTTSPVQTEHISHVHAETSFRSSRWFSRGWTLQELVAPTSVEFFSVEGDRLGDRVSMVSELQEITGIPVPALQGHFLSQFGVIERMSWAAHRVTKVGEDAAYSLLGILDISMPIIYGEGKEKAMFRLHREIVTVNTAPPDSDPYRIPLSLKGVPLVNKFVGRASELRTLEEQLLPSLHHKRRKVVVLHGLGGIGKTQLTAEFARRNSLQFSGIFWLDGRDEDTLKQSIASSITRIPSEQLPNTSQPKNPQSIDEVDLAIKAVMDWLCHPGNSSWLLIFDNADQDYYNLQAAPNAYDIRRYFPPVDSGSIIITTRLSHLAQLGNQLNVSKVDNGQALEILQCGSAGDKEASEESDEPLHLLDGLPLALAQASAFIREAMCSIGDYIQFYRNEWRDLMGARTGSMKPVLEYENGIIWTTWSISFREIQLQDQTAAKLLLLWTCLDNKDLSFDLLRQASLRVTSQGGSLSDWLTSIANNKLSFVRTMRLLLCYSLSESTSSGEYSIHPLVHEWAWQTQDTVMQAENCRLAVILIGYAIALPNEREYWKMTQYLSPHADQLTTRLAETGYASTTPSAFYFKALESLGDLYALRQYYDEAEAIYLKVLEESERALGTYSNPTITIVACLAHLYLSTERYHSAERMFLRAFEGFEKLRGPEHPDTLSIMNSLCTLYAGLGRRSDAVSMYLRSLKGMEKLGPEHPSSLDTIENLGRIYFDQGDFIKAEQAFLRALYGRESVLGKDRTATIKVASNLSSLYLRQQELVKAEIFSQRVLEASQIVLGQHHSLTLERTYFMGRVYQKLGKTDQAEKLFLQVLDEAVNSPYTASKGTVLAISRIAFYVSSRLGAQYAARKEFDQAETMCQHALAYLNETRALDKANISQSSLSASFYLAWTLSERKEYSKGQYMYYDVLEGFDRTGDQEGVAKTCHKLGALTLDQGNFDRLRFCISGPWIGTTGSSIPSGWL